LSPLLFVSVMEVLNAMVAEADHVGLLSPLPGNGTGQRMSLYADDLVIFLAPKPEDFTCVWAILDLFAGASGLITNLDKCSKEDIALVRQAFPCQLASFPCRYLGAPLTMGRMLRSEEQQLVDAIARRIPTWKGNLLNTAGRTTLTRAMLSAIPVHVSITCCLSPWATRQIDKRRRAFLWIGSDAVVGGKCKISWPVVCSPKCYDGLGIPDIRILGYVLRLHWE
jgi:hypothetical protein